jgi:hypothetical protein
MRIRSRRAALAAAALAPVMTLAACGGGGGDTNAAAGECGDVTLRLSHQWPAATGGEDGDFRAELAQ